MPYLFATRTPLLAPRAVWLLVTACCVSGCGQEPTVRTTTAQLDVGALFEIDDLKSLQELPVPADLDMTALGRLVHTAPVLDSLRLFTAVADFEDAGEINLVVAAAPLSGSLEGGWVAVAASREGSIIGGRLWGNPAFDEDPDASWENLWRQVAYRELRSAEPPDAMPDAEEVDRIVHQLRTGDQPDDHMRRSLYEHADFMRSNSYLIRHIMATAEGDRSPAEPWVQSYLDGYRRMTEPTAALVEIMGPVASRKYVSLAADGVTMLESMVEAASVSDGSRLKRDVQTFRRQMCGNCHGIESHNAGEGDLQPAVLRAMAERGLRRDLYRIGVDLTAAPGTSEDAQRVADAFRVLSAVCGWLRGQPGGA